MPTITISVDGKKATAMLEKMLRKVRETAPLMRIIGETIKTSVERNFSAGGRPRWKVSRRAREDGGQTLSLTGRLRRSIAPRAGAGWVAVGTNVKYAAAHQFGAKTGPRIIEPKRKKALRTPYGIFRRVRHPGSTIPARPFLMVQDEDWAEIRETVNDYMIR